MKVNTNIVATPWFVRYGIYVLVAGIGLVMTVLGFAQPDQVDSWVHQSGSLAALVGGLLAAANTGKHSDRRIPEPRPTPHDDPAPVLNDLDELRRSFSS